MQGDRGCRDLMAANVSVDNFFRLKQAGAWLQIIKPFIIKQMNI